MKFEEMFPAVTDIPKIDPSELAPFVLRYLKGLGNNNPGDLNRRNFGLIVSRIYGKGEIPKCFVEAWMWLEQEGFLVPNPEQDVGWFIVSRKGDHVLEGENFEAYKKSSLFPSYLDPVLVRTVKPLFLRGDYDTAVFRAFKEVEVRVRQKAKYTNEEYGRDLMVHAFGQNGPLANATATRGERDAMRELFAGAISACKNPSSHREVQFDDAGEAIDMICFANQLLRIVDRV